MVLSLKEIIQENIAKDIINGKYRFSALLDIIPDEICSSIFETCLKLTFATEFRTFPPTDTPIKFNLFKNPFEQVWKPGWECLIAIEFKNEKGHFESYDFTLQLDTKDLKCNHDYSVFGCGEGHWEDKYEKELSIFDDIHTVAKEMVLHFKGEECSIDFDVDRVVSTLKQLK